MQRKLEFWIITSTEDIASMNIRNHLLEDYPFKKSEDDSDPWIIWENHPTFLLGGMETKCVNIRLVMSDTAMIMLDDRPTEKIKNFIGADFMIFASRHKAKSAMPALLCHSTGNWSNDTSFGGEPKSLCMTSARLLRLGYQNLKKHKKLNSLEWPVDLEVNHHGPTQFNIPLIFMELGSVEDNWSNITGGKAVADAIMDTIQQYIEEAPIHFPELSENFSRNELLMHIRKNESGVALGMGGVHYARNFSKLLDKISISFITPKYFIAELNEVLLEQMIQNTIEPVEYAIIDWNSLNSGTRKELISLLERKSIPWKKRKIV